MAEVSVHSGVRRLCLYGMNNEIVFNALDNPKYHSSIEEMSFGYQDFTSVVVPTFIPKLHLFERLTKIYFVCNRLTSFRQLTCLKKLPSQVTEVVVQIKDPLAALEESKEGGTEGGTEGENAVSGMSLYRLWMAYKVRNIHVVNGTRITDSERLKGHTLFSTISINATKSSSKAEYKSRSKRDVARSQRHGLFARTYLNVMKSQVVEIEDRVKVVNGLWNGVVGNIVKETLTLIDTMESRKEE